MEALKLMCGAQITSPSDRLMKVSADYVADKLRNPNPEIEAKIRMLRDMRSIDEKQYREFKKQLPYLVNGMFNQQIRRSDNFAYIESFIIDLDHLKDKGLGVVSLKNAVSQDTRTLMCFVSPSEDGLKVMFRLRERCYDAAIFKMFYKKFAKSFAAHHDLVQVVDTVTCDVTRACFMSVDRDVYYNPDAETVDLKAYIDPEDTLGMFDTKHAQEKEAKKAKTPDEPARNPDPDDEQMRKIQELIGSRRQKPPASRPPVHVPERVSMIIPDLKEFLSENGVEAYDVVDIQEAKKVRMKLGLKLAEVNIFCGQSGYKVVMVNRRGTDSELNLLVKQLIELYIAEH